MNAIGWVGIGWIGGWAVRSAILIVLGATLLRALRVKDPAIRLAAWTAMLAMSLAIPALTAALPRIALVPAHAAAPAGEILPIVDQAPPVIMPAGKSIAAPANSGPFDWARLALMVYLSGAAFLLLRLGVGLAMSRRLLRASRATGLTGVLESDAVAAPVALGILRPTIVLPADWGKWDTARLDAVLAHERSHVRRGDPAVQFLSAIHRAVLWYSPLSWFLHRSIVRAAEEASDDAAVAATGDRASYAQTLLEFMMGSRENWGVGMARYGSPEERVHRILDGAALSSGATRGTLAAMVALGAPLVYVVAAAQTLPSFDVASVKTAEPLPPPGPDGVVMVRTGSAWVFPTVEPGRIHYPRWSLMGLLTTAYQVESFQIEGPKWLSEATFDIDATMPPETTPRQLHQMWQSLLAERFKLAVHRETREFTGYSLTVSKTGLKLKEGTTAPAPVAGIAPVDKDGFPTALEHGLGGPPAGRVLSDMPPLGFFSPLGRRFFFQQRSTQYLAGFLAQNLRCPVADNTGLTVPYDFTLTYLPEGQPPLADGNYPPAPDLFTAVEKQLGLRLEKKKISADVIVVDRIERTPTAN